MNNNNLEGTIVDQFAAAPDLKILFLNENSFEGDLMTLLSGHETKLTLVGLKGNRFSGSLTSEVGEMRLVTSFNLQDNFDISGELPTEIGLMRQLTDLNLEATGIGGNLPTEMGNMRTLSKLDLGRTNVEGTIPEEWSGMSNLKELNLEGTLMEGTVPQSVCDLPNLEQIVPSNDMNCVDCPLCFF